MLKGTSDGERYYMRVLSSIECDDAFLLSNEGFNTNDFGFGVLLLEVCKKEMVLYIRRDDVSRIQQRG